MDLALRSECASESCDHVAFKKLSAPPIDHAIVAMSLRCNGVALTMITCDVRFLVTIHPLGARSTT